ncbi:MAG: putative transcriptional regulator [Candidatus Tokpelaia sp. JSC085]|nr:MAG: putative transcriptional regulator [Candidatus Tokpelaia sp. JSC085]
MNVQEKVEENNEKLIALTAGIVSAYVSNNVCRTDNLPALITEVHAALAHAESIRIVEMTSEKQKPAVHPKRSITDEYIICLEDGKKFKSLKRHLMTHYNMTPEQYREKWDLGADYPMVAPHYAKARSMLAKEMGLGHQRTRKEP